jgi:hypothetical protein
MMVHALEIARSESFPCRDQIVFRACLGGSRREKKDQGACRCSKCAGPPAPRPEKKILCHPATMKEEKPARRKARRPVSRC